MKKEKGPRQIVEKLSRNKGPVLQFVIDLRKLKLINSPCVPRANKGQGSFLGTAWE